MLNEQIKRIKNLMLLKEQEENNLSSYMDSTYLKTPEQAGIDEEETDVIVFDTIKDAIDHNMKLVMLRPEYVKSAREFIDDKGANVLVGTVIGLDYVVNYKAFKKGDLDTIKKEVSEGTAIGIDAGKSVKWIIESAALSDDEISNLTSLIRDVVVQTVGPEKANNVFVKTSTGFYKAEDDRPIGATPEAVSLMKSNSGPLQVKASGGIYSIEDAEKMINAGATRLGTSAAKDIMKGNKIEKTDY